MGRRFVAPLRPRSRAPDHEESINMEPTMRRYLPLMLALAAAVAAPPARAAEGDPCPCAAPEPPKPAKPKRARAARKPVLPTQIALPSAPPPANISPVATASVNVGAASHLCVSSLGANAATTGQVWTDRNCLLVSKSAMLWNVGKQEAAVSLLCSDADMRRALETSGTPCPAGAPKP
jgi:hypothetical protein